MRTIEKKVYQEYFQKILTGEKTFEVRLADFEVSPGDLLWLREIDAARQYTGREIHREISYCFNTKTMEKWHSKDEIDKHGLVFMTLKPTDNASA